MATQTRTEPHAKKFGENIESDLALEFLRVVENAAIESALLDGLSALDSAMQPFPFAAAKSSANLSS